MIGREDQLEVVASIVAGARERLTAVVFEGAAGIGKTTVFREALRVADTNGFRVFACRPGETDAAVSFTAVGDLFGAVSDAELGALSAPQRRAVEVALLRAEPKDGGRFLDQRAVAAGVRSLIVAIAAERPVLVAVDDVQWLDSASVSVLSFVLRRLGPEHVGVVATRRVGEPPRLDLDCVVPREMLTRQQLGPLSAGALQHLLRAQFGDAFPRALLARIHHASGGNPLFALEIGRVLADCHTSSATEPLPVPSDVRELVRARVAALPGPTRDLLLAASLLAVPSVATLMRTFARHPDADLEPAERAGVAHLHDGVVTFEHPLHAAAVIANATGAGRRRMHIRLAATVADPEERGHHLAMGIVEVDERVAETIEQGAVAARERGSLQTAADLLEHARTLTPEHRTEVRQRRGVVAAELHMHAGDRARSRSLLEELLDEPLTQLLRADALRLLGELCLVEENLPDSERLLGEALTLAAEDPRLAARIQAELAYVGTLQMDFGAAADHARQALAVLSECDDGPLLAEALVHSAMCEFLAGRGVDWSTVEQALQLEDPNHLGLIGMPPGGVAACLMMFVGRHDDARQLMSTVCARLADRGDERDLATTLLWLSWLETRAANFEVAAGLAADALSCAELAAYGSMERWAAAQAAWVDAHVGRVGQVRKRVGSLSSDAAGVTLAGLWCVGALALAEVSVGHYEAAWQAAQDLTEMVERHGVVEPVVLHFLPDALEALIALGHLDRAEALLDSFECRAREHDRVWALATAARCRGLLLAARGDLGGAAGCLQQALAEDDRIAFPYERARTLLAIGVVQRRSRRRARSREALEEAAREFERMGAHVWAERAGEEIARLGSWKSQPVGELTAAERRVVEAAMDGLSNKEIAATLFVTTHTVEIHLSKAYKKLGIRSRSQLARALQTLKVSGISPSAPPS